MKNSEIQWVGEIPINWGLKRIQFCLKEINVKNTPIQTTQVLSLLKDVGVLPYEEKGDIGNKSKENVSEYHLAYPNTIVLNCMNILIGSVGISNYFGCVSPVYYVFKETKNSDLRFINYIFSTREFQKELRKYAKGILEIRLRVSAYDILKRKIALPSKKEQTKIANFLDKKCSEIDSLYSDIEKQIEILEEYKKSVITEAVTKGLNPDVEMKDSGIEWIGMIPKHWVKQKIKNACSLLGSGTTPSSNVFEYYENGDIHWIQSGDIYQVNEVADTKTKITQLGLRSSPSLKIYTAPFIVVAMYGASVGNAAISKVTACANQACCCIKTNNDNDLRYLYYWINHCKPDFLSIAAGGGQPNISQDKIKNQHFVAPPINEQKDIANHLDQKCSEIDAIIATKKTQLEILAEYKKSLIYECVTGKKEVN